MKKGIWVIALVFILFSVASLACADYRIYGRVGGMALSENGTPEGHKAFATTSLDIMQYIDPLTITYTLEFLSMIEAEDDDPEMIHQGYKAGLELKQNNWITPYFGAYLERFSRNKNPKYPNGLETLDFIDVTAGLEIHKGIYYARVGANYPVWVDGPDGRVDLDASAGVILGNWNAGISYRKLSFSGDENQPTLRVNFPAFEIGYRF